MARVNLPHTEITRAGVAAGAEVTGDSTNHHSTANDGRVFLLVRNGNGAATARTVTLIVPGTIDGQSVASRTVSIAAGASRYIGPFPKATYGGTVNVNVEHSDLKLTAYHI